MSKKKLCIIIVAAVAALAIAAALFFLLTKGTVAQKDGLLQNSRIYITDVYIENKSICYTVVNKTFQSQPIAETPYVQRLTDGVWEIVGLAGESENLPQSCAAFTSLEKKLEVKYPRNLTNGEYRLVFGNIRKTWRDAQLYPSDWCVVGYFTVEGQEEVNVETGPQVVNRGELYVEDGLYQNSLITLEITNESLTAPVEKINYRILNASTCAQSRVNMFPSLQIKKDGKWVTAPGYSDDILRVHRDVWAYTEAVLVLEKELVLASEGYEPLAPGEYRLAITLDILCDGVVTVYPVGYFTVTAE